MNLHQIWNSWINALTNTEPKIERKCDRAGNCYFQVYDPITGRSSTFGSAEEILYWLEARYYQ
jgi:hypothetical protein